MDAMKNAADFDDEEIIDLTDIIEKGAAPARKGGDLLGDQLSDLASTSHDDGQSSIDLDMDADIDALLAQMGGDPSQSAPENSISGMGQESAHHQDVNPDETLDMPGMAEVDSLLQELDMPPQPASPQAAGNELENLDDSPASPASAVDLDALLDGMLDGNSAPQTAPPAAEAPDDALRADPAGPNADFAAALSADLDDLDALLGNDTAAPAPAATPAAPAAAPTAPAAAPAGPDFSLDDIDALLGNDTAAPAAPAPAMDIPEPLNVADLDALLGQANIPATANAGYVPDVADLANLDSLLGAVATPAHEPSPDTLNMLKNFDDTPSMPHAADTPVPSLAEDLMALDVMLNAEASAQEEPLVTAAPVDDHPVTTRELMSSAPSTADDGLLADLDALLSGATLDLSPSAEDGAAEETTPPAEDGDTWRDPLPDFDTGEIHPEASSVDSLLEDIDPQELNRAAQELLDEKVMLEATTGDVDTSAWLSSLDEALDEAASLDETLDNAGAISEAGSLDETGAIDATAGGTLPEDMTVPADDNLLAEGIVPSLSREHAGDEAAGLPEGIVPPMPLAAAAALGATAVAMAAGKSGALSPASAAAAAHLSEEDRARISELEERLMVLEEQWPTREAAHRQLLEHMGTQDLHNSERLSALEARLASVQSEAQAESNARLTQLEFRLDDVINQPAPAPMSTSLSEEDEELRAARLDLMDGRIMVLEDAEEQRCAKEKAAEEDAASMAQATAAEDLPEAVSGDALGDLPQDQSALPMLEERLAALESQTAQGQVELEERLTELEGQYRQLESSMGERLSALQGHFQQLENAIEERLEQKAAAAAAKIIREEIAALLTE